MTDEYDDEPIDGTGDAGSESGSGWGYEEKKRGLSKEAIVGIVTILALVGGGGWAIFNALSDDNQTQNVAENEGNKGGEGNEDDDSDPFKNRGNENSGTANTGNTNDGEGNHGESGPIAQNDGQGGTDSGTSNLLYNDPFGRGNDDGTNSGLIDDGVGGNAEPSVDTTGRGNSNEGLNNLNTGSAAELLADNQNTTFESNTGLNNTGDTVGNTGFERGGSNFNNTGINGEGNLVGNSSRDAFDPGTGLNTGEFDSGTGRDLTTGPFPSTTDQSSFNSETGTGLTGTREPDIDRPIGLLERGNSTGSQFNNGEDFNSNRGTDAGSTGIDSPFIEPDTETSGISDSTTGPFPDRSGAGSPFETDTNNGSTGLAGGNTFDNNDNSGRFPGESNNLTSDPYSNDFNNGTNQESTQPFGTENNRFNTTGDFDNSNSQFTEPTIGNGRSETGTGNLFNTDSDASSTRIGTSNRSPFGSESGTLGSSDTEYIVKEGENFWSISRSVYGSSRYFQQLADYNRSRVPDPGRMRPGVKIVTPPLSVLTGGRVSARPNSLTSTTPDRSEFTTDTTGRGNSVDAGESTEESGVPEQGIYFTSQGYPMFRVGRDDTLTTIAAEHLGRWARWRQVYEMNRDQVDDPNKLRIGMSLKLPADASRSPLVNLNRTLR